MLVHEVGKIGRKYLGKKIKSSLDCIEFKVPFRHLSGNVNRQLGTEFGVLGIIQDCR